MLKNKTKSITSSQSDYLIHILNSLRDCNLQERTKYIATWASEKGAQSPQCKLGGNTYENILNFILLNSIDKLIKNEGTFKYWQNYRLETDRLFIRSANNRFDDRDYAEIQKSNRIIPYTVEQTTSNSEAFKKLNLIDVQLGNSNVYNPKQNYIQEYNRQNQFQEIKEALYQNEGFLDFFHTIDSILQSEFFRKMPKTKVTQTFDLMKLWE